MHQKMQKMKVFYPLKMILYAGLVLCCLLPVGCSSSPKECTTLQPEIFPDYRNVTIPVNIAPLNFRMAGATKITAEISLDGKSLYHTQGKDIVSFSESKWKEMLLQARGETLSVEVSVWNKQHPEGIRYQPFPINVSSDSITPYIAYRLIPPGYVLWKKMGIYQRSLESFQEECLVSNKQNHEGCVNCHSFHNYSPDLFLFHARGQNGCSVLVKNGKPERLELDQIPPHFKGTYPYWHPSGRYVVLSNCDTHQGFYGHSRNKVEVYDLNSDLMIYDLQNNRVITDPRFTTKEEWETFPTFSPDGKSLYLCQAKACNMPVEYDRLKYALIRIDFYPENGQLGTQTDTLYNPIKEGGSASFPRISPDGQHLLFTESGCGTFPIWHKDADLRMICLNTGKYEDTTPINSPDVDSYHSWDQSGRWLIFSSRRIDGRYTRLFIAHYQPGKGFSKPFLLPQKDPAHNEKRLYSYNIPEFISRPVSIAQQETADLFQ